MNADEILNDDEFKAALAKAHEAQTNNSTNKARFSASDLTWDLAGYYKHELKATWDHLDSIARNKKYKLSDITGGFERIRKLRPDDFSVVAAGVTGKQRMALLGHMGSLIDFVVCKYHAGKHHDKSQIAPLTGGAGGGTFAHYGVAKVAENFRNNITSLCDRLVEDWLHIETLFFQGRDDIGLEDTCLEQLTRIQTTGSDPHKGGKQAYILHFSAVPKQPRPLAPRDGVVAINVALVGDEVGDSSANVLNRSERSVQQLIYKPADLELDTRLIGATKILIERLGKLAAPSDKWVHKLPDFSRKSLFECANDDNPGLELAVYRILPRGCGSCAQNRPIKIDPTKHDKVFPIQEAYGFIEFLAHEPRVENLHEVDTKTSDWVTENAGDRDLYHRQFGFICALGHLVGMADAHEENARICRKKLHLIDCEISFKIQGPGIPETLLSQQIQTARVSDHECILVYKNGDGFNASWVPTDDGDETPKTRALEGLNAGLDYIRDDPRGSVKNWLKDPHLERSVARITLRATKDYGSLRHEFWESCAYQDLPGDVDDASSGAHGGPRTTATGKDDPRIPFDFLTSLKAWYDTPPSNQNDHRPVFALAQPAFDWTCFLNVDYPCHYRRLGSLDVMNARGQTLHIGQPLTPHQDAGARKDRKVCGPRYFQSYAGAELFRVAGGLPPPLMDRLNREEQGLEALRPHFALLGIDLDDPVYEVKERDRRWHITETRTDPGFWCISYLEGAGNRLKLDVRLYRDEADRQDGNQSRLTTLMITGIRSGAKNPSKRPTPSKMNKEAGIELAKILARTSDTDNRPVYDLHLTEGKKRGPFRANSKAPTTILHKGSQWKVTEPDRSPYWFIQANPTGGDTVIFRAHLVRDEDDHPKPGEAFGTTTPMNFTIPTELAGDELDQSLIAKVAPTFEQECYKLSDDAEAFIDKSKQFWHIVDQGVVYHVVLKGKETIVSLGTTGIDMARRQHARLQVKEIHDPIREKMVRDLTTDARTVGERGELKNL